MQRIFAVLAVLNNLLLIVAFVLGWQLEDALLRSAEGQGPVNQHFLVALGALVFAMLVHAIMLTYFMGTGRWMEDTSQAYQLDERFRKENQSLKYRTLPWMMLCITLLVLLAASGGASDPAAGAGFGKHFGMEEATLHLWLAVGTLLLNIVINIWEYIAIRRNGGLILEILAEVRQIRMEKGLPVE